MNPIHECAKYLQLCVLLKILTLEIILLNCTIFGSFERLSYFKVRIIKKNSKNSLKLHN